MINKFEKKNTEVRSKVEPILLNVEKPGRYIGGELNSVIKENAEINFGFCFPDTYEIGMSYLGLQIIYDVLNKKDGVYCQRFFAPNTDMEELMRANDIPLFSIEKMQPAIEMDMIGFTLQYELSYTNVLNMLDLAKIPLRSKDRGDDYPLICAGGNCSFNPEPLADVIDFFMIGDGEDLLVEVMDVIHEGNEISCGKTEMLKRLASLEGIYVPLFYEHIYDDNGNLTEIKKTKASARDVVSKRVVSDMDSAEFPDKPLVPLIETVHDRSVVEIFRGCTRGCRFCQAGMICRPIRERSVEKIMELADKQLKNTGHEELSLLSLSTSDYSNVEDLVKSLMVECKKRDIGLSLPSLRLDSFSFSVLQEIQEYRKSGLTFAPEAGTQRLRNVINKTITDEQICFAVREALKLGWTNIKLYFMIGLPTETDEDLDGIIEIAKRINEIYIEVTEKKTRFNLTISVSNFVPKPHTPFQWVSQDTPEEFNRKHMYLKDRLKSLRGVSFQYHDSDVSVLEAVLARGDRKIGEAVLMAWKSGCKFDSWSEHFKYDLWMKAFKECGIDPSTYSSSFSSNAESVLPWDTINCGVSKDFMKNEYRLALQGEQTPDCRFECGACGITKITDCPAARNCIKNGK